MMTDLNQLRQLEQQWEEVRTKNPQSGFCLRWDWLVLWCDIYLRARDKLFIQLFYQGDDLVAIIPFYLKRLSLGYELRFIGTGESEASEIVSEFQDFIIAEGLTSSIKENIFHQLNQTISERSDIVAMQFDDLLPNAYCSQFFKNLCEEGWSQRKTVDGHRFTVSILANNTLQQKAVSSATNRRKLRKLSDKNDLSYRLLIEESDFDEMYDSLVVIHQRNWLKRGKCGAFSCRQFDKFHRQFARQQLRINNLIMFSIVRNQQCVAVFYGFIDKDTLSYYQSGIERIDGVDYLGVAMHFKAIELARQHGLKHYDLMRGKNTSYKGQLTKIKTVLSALRIYRRANIGVLVNRLISKISSGVLR